MFNKPYDLAYIVGIFGLIIITIGFGITSAVDFGAETNNKVGFYTGVYNNISSESGFKGSADEATLALTGEAGVSEQITEDSVILNGFQSLISLGKTYKTLESSLTISTGYLGIDPIYWLVITGLILITFAVVLYTWVRGK